MFSHDRALLLALVLVVGPSCTGGGCSPAEEEDDGETPIDCNTCPLPVTSQEPVSFKNDLFKDDNAPGIFRRACNLASCHGINPGSKAGLYLGPERGPLSVCGPDTGAGACTTGTSDNCGEGKDDKCSDPAQTCLCGEQQCPTGSQRCIASPDGGASACGAPSDGGACAIATDCNGGAVGTCNDPPAVCTCGDGRCAPGERCTASPADEMVALRAAVIANVVNVRSKTHPSMVLVKPFEPENSFLMMKVDGCHSCLGLENCPKGTTGNCCSVQSGALPGDAVCGDRMPRGSDVLSAAERDVIRRWIAQGALNDP